MAQMPCGVAPKAGAGVASTAAEAGQIEKVRERRNPSSRSEFGDDKQNTASIGVEAGVLLVRSLHESAVLPPCSAAKDSSRTLPAQRGPVRLVSLRNS